MESTGWAREGGDLQKGRYGGLSVMLAVKCTLRNWDSLGATFVVQACGRRDDPKVTMEEWSERQGKRPQ